VKRLKDVTTSTSLFSEAHFSQTVTNSRAGFGVDFQAQLQPGKNQIIKDWECVFEAIASSFENPLYAYMGPERFKKYTSAGKSYSEAKNRLVATVKNVIASRLKENNSHHHDLLQYCIDSAGDNHDEKKFTEDELTHEIMLFFVAGIDTTANMLSWALYNIAKNPEIKTKILEEIRDAGAPLDDSMPNWSVVGNLPYMTQVLKEALRLYPPTTFVSRRLIKDEKFREHTFPGGTTFYPMIYSIQRDLRHYPCQDVNEFNPDHFSPEKDKARHLFAWIPFAIGLRNCIGMQFGMVEARTLLSYLLPRLEFSVTSDPEIFHRVLLSSKMKLRVKKMSV